VAVIQHAIVRLPGENFAEGLTGVNLGLPVYARARQQHEEYCAALEQCGLKVIRLEADEQYPDSTFIEDTAVLTEHCAVLTNPGAPSRAGEVESIGKALSPFYSELHYIHDPDTVEGGDICQAGNHFFIGISARTNETGAQQLARLLTAFDYTSSFVDIREVEGILHLKSGLAYLGANCLVVIEALANRAECASYDLIRVGDGDEYAANCVAINGSVLVAAGHDGFDARLRKMGYQTVALEMSEFQKMDGGLSCLSLRF
jgi:dimethylargininase